ncbi:winged helix-turn-helix domain-containing protein [Uliginosibacterium sp. 31-12]|uniref:winged helix-turn-helix domain-containing protein n=1 Tax=Uliginosibacterium sp. 31-12 TaxID=3062781 RepID=UPI0026E32FEB|nr:winged helix-turn-helix domain-containing protein [Uliginosibacterium sp. 31-12]MDO6386650.1 winged helix-turn-helix domain-containing protein [Uliginosibacterium sp. 31-12]
MNAPRPANILVVEDEPKMAGLLLDYLRAEGHHPRHLAEGSGVEAVVRASPPDLILLDLMLPGLDGLAVCRALRAFCAVPIIMLTARSEEADRLAGLDGGADDYIGKTPFSPREVMARVRAQLRRAQGRVTALPSTPQLRIDDGAWQASLDGQLLDLTPAEFRLLRVLAAAPGQVFSREQLLDQLHDDHRAVTDRTVDSHIKNLRRKLGTACGSDPIHSIYGVGYRFQWPEQKPATPG